MASSKSAALALCIIAVVALATAAPTAAPVAAAAGANDTCPGGAKGCYVVKDYWPVKTCKFECAPEVCNKGWGAWQSEEVCCAPGVAFPEGCGKRPTDCWVVENYQLRTCIRDDRKCLQGYGIWPSKAACCAPDAGFPEGCRADIPEADTPCYVVDTYFPARLCRPSTTMCTPESGMQSWPTAQACCAPGAAFGEGCSEKAPTAPCWVTDSYYPLRRCRQEDDIAVCSRGWGVYNSENICCAHNVAFPEGCSPAGVPVPAAKLAMGAGAGNATTTLSVPEADAEIKQQAALLHQSQLASIQAATQNRPAPTAVTP